ncbi:hypothetical protein [Ruegeria profundi]|uniref:hypothetical protein n=1 Tax=Ruegeria profundi TaxID=1685378 RepID=UPI001CD6B7DB|nr:hypothetical protein [Ruegeria profundi]MCA0927505.1 hypothetical protein [Ruegeria profundi]
MIRTAAICMVCLCLMLVPAAYAESPIAEVICEPTSRMHEKLTRQFRAKRTATGVRSPEQVMEVWTSKSGDWTMVMTYATGTSCIVAMGHDWHAHADEDPARG